MKQILTPLILFSLLLGWLEGFSQNLSNRGKDFWVGYGHHQFMEAGQPNSQEMVIYLSAEQPANVTVTIEGTGWVRNYAIPANTVIATEYIPKAGAIDARLISVPCSFVPPGTPCGGEGTFSNKGIHIVSDVPIVAYAHIFGSASSGASMLMPVETWGYTYTSINSIQSYATNCFSWVYAIAQENNTVIEVTPSVATRAGRPAGVPFTVTLQRGEIYQTMAGPETGSVKPEMTGTRIRSIANAAGNCYPIAVFSGSSRTGNPAACGSGGGDNDNQQCFPSQAWGKRYLTAPTSNSNTPSAMMVNSYKIAVKDPTTVVKRNGVVLTGLINGSYYRYESNAADYIESDKPVMVAQFMTGGSTCQGGGGVGDPEMMYISPVEQGIKKIGFYRNNRESITVNYLTLIIPTNGISTLLIDGSPAFDHSYAHPRLAGYSVVVKRWPSAQSQAIVSSDSAFTAVTYGLGSVESYGYNAGTLINNLNAVMSIHNTLDPATPQHPYTCTGTPVQLSVLMANIPTRLDWLLSQLGSVITPNADVIDNAPVSSGTVVINGITYYKYTLPGTYIFNVADTFDIPINWYNPTIENCYQREQVKVPVIVKARPLADFTFTHSGCTLDPVSFSGVGTTSNSFTIRDFNWTFPGPITATGQNVSQLLPPGTHNINLSVVSNEGCASDTIKQITIYDKPPAEFQVLPLSVCQGAAFTMTDTSAASIAVNNWYWDFGNAVTQTVTTGPSVTYTYPLAGTYIVRHASSSSATCVSDTATRQVIVYAKPTVSFTNNASGCLDISGLVQFTGTATTPDGQAFTSYAWNFNDPNATAGNPNTSAAQNPTHNFQQGTYTINFSATTVNGCTKDTNITVTFNLKPQITYPALNPVCANTPALSIASATVTNGPAVPPGIYKGPGTSLAGIFDPAAAGPGNHTIWYVFTTSAGCIDSAFSTITVNPVPAKPVAVTPVEYCQNATAAALSAAALAGNTLTWFNNTALTGGTPTAFVPSTTTPGVFYFYVNQTNSTTGCISDTSRIAVTVLNPITGNTIGTDQTVCGGTAPATITATGTLAGGNGLYTYQWQQSTDGGATWNNIGGATAATLNPSAVTGATQYRRIVADGLCSSTSNVVTITVQGSMTSFDIGASQVICDGTTPALLNGQTPVGGSGVFVYEWESSPDGTAWTTIAGATGEDYQPAAITTTTYYRRKVTSGACAATSSVVTITVNPSPNGSITGSTTICSYDAAAVSFTATAGTAPFTISITVNGPAGTNTITQAVATNGPVTIPVIPVNSAAGSYTVSLTNITDNTGCFRNTGLSVLTITVNPKPVLAVSPGVAICANASTTLTASGATTYAWSPATGLSSTTGNSVTANPAATTTYQVIGITNGCNDTAFVTVTVNPVPGSPVVTSPLNYCQGPAPAAQLTATGAAGNTLTWYNNAGLTGGTTTAPAPVLATAGTFTYYVTETNGFNCQGAASIITVNVAPFISNNTIAADQTICSGTSAAAFTAATPAGGNGTYGYQWQQSTDGGANWNDIPGATASLYNAGAITVTTQYRRNISSGVCNSTSNVITVTVQPAITNFDVAGTQTICAGTTPAILDGQAAAGGSGVFTYQWESSPDCTTWSAIPGATAEDYQPAALATTTSYRRKVTGGACSAISACVTVTVNAMPNGSITGPSVICSYDAADISFTATTGTAPFTISITVNGPSGTNTITQTIATNGPASVNVIPANSPAGSYSVALMSITDNIGCSKNTGLTTLNITVNAKPVLVVSANTTICQTASTTLTASGAATYTWSPAAGLSGTTGNSVTANPATTTTYRVIGVTNSCSDTAFVTVTVNPIPSNSPVPAVNYCQNATALPLTTTAAPGHILTWYNNPGLTGGTGVAPTPSTATPGTVDYYVTQTNTATGCRSSAVVVSVKVNPLPVADFNIPTGICMPGGAAVFTNNSTVADNSALTYNWDFGDAAGTSSANNPSYVYGATGSYNVTLTATSAFGCATTSAPKTVDDFYDKPIAAFTVTPAEICQGVNIVFNENSTAPNSTIQSWSWNYGDNSAPGVGQIPTKQFTNPGTYTINLTVTNAIGCKSDPYPQTVRVHLQPVIDAGRSFVVPQGTPIQFEATANSPSLTFSWSPAAGLNNAAALKPTTIANADNTYTLTATGEFGCTATDFITVKILKPVNVPNVFSPNGDGIHDKWMIPNLAEYPGCTVDVFNRYGQQVLRSTGYGTPWDGTFKGKDLPVGTYYYVIILQNGFKPISGSITIVR
jgi:gliding motility-associated-like protein